MRPRKAKALTCDAGLDNEAQGRGLHVRERGRLRHELEEVRVQLRSGAHAQVAEVGDALLHAVCGAD